MFVRALVGMALLVVMRGVCFGGDTTVVRVEEDWEVLIGTPDPFLDTPQIVTVFGPADPETGVHAVFELNHGTLPEFSEGGMQLQYWSGETLKGYRRQKAPTEFSTAGETVTYTTVTEIENGNLTMAVTNGKSRTFGEFGDESTLRIQVKTTEANLNGMGLENSLRHSKVTYGANRVQKFQRTRVQMLNAAGEVVATDSQVRDIR